MRQKSRSVEDALGKSENNLALDMRRSSLGDAEMKAIQTGNVMVNRMKADAADRLEVKG